jgi:hypothetical protein
MGRKMQEWEKKGGKGRRATLLSHFLQFDTQEEEKNETNHREDKTLFFFKRNKNF